MKMITFLIPCYNEEKNVVPMYESITKIMNDYREIYDYEIIFRDNDSTDNTKESIYLVAQGDMHVKGIINARNYGKEGPIKSTFQGRVSGDVLITIAADFQEPPELIPEFIKWWEAGYEVVCGIKTSSREGKIKYGLRQIFYHIIADFSDIRQYSNMSGINLRSRRIYELQLASGAAGMPFRYFVSELGIPIKTIEYEQQKRRSGKSSYNAGRYLSFAISSLTSNSTKPLRIATVAGFVMSIISFIAGFLYLILKVLFWQRYSAGMAAVLIGMFFIGSVQLFFIGIVGEYVGSILRQIRPKIPPVVTELVNYNVEQKEKDPYYFESPLNNSLMGDEKGK